LKDKTMQEPENVRSAIEAAASNPKVATLVAASTTGVGAATQFGLIDGWLSRGAMIVGLITAVVVLGIQLIRLEMALRERAQGKKESP
jgi:hypothetical protein